jgi:hypothetical protein
MYTRGPATSLFTSAAVLPQNEQANILILNMADTSINQRRLRLPQRSKAA